MLPLLSLRYLILAFYSLSPAQAQSSNTTPIDSAVTQGTTSTSVGSSSSTQGTSSVGTSSLVTSTSTSASPSTSAVPNFSMWHYIPTASNQFMTQIVSDTFKIGNYTMFFDVIRCDYPVSANPGLIDIGVKDQANWAACAESCAQQTLTNRTSPCNGMTFVNGSCWMKNGLYRYSSGIPSDTIISGLLYYLH